MMNSFYDVPRNAPLPKSADKKVPAAPVVPEVSMIFNNRPVPSAFANQLPSDGHMLYNEWKSVNHNITSDTAKSRFVSNPDENKENRFNTQNSLLLGVDDRLNSSQLYKKQVRFESPPLQSKRFPSQVGAYGDDKSNINSYEKPKLQANAVKHSTDLSPTFEQMYMANIPNRHLDLSMIDSSQRNKPNRDGCPSMMQGKGSAEKDTECYVNTTASSNCAYIKNKVHQELSSDAKSKFPESSRQISVPSTYKEFKVSQQASRDKQKEFVSDVYHYKSFDKTDDVVQQNKLHRGDLNVSNGSDLRGSSANVQHVTDSKFNHCTSQPGFHYLYQPYKDNPYSYDSIKQFEKCPSRNLDGETTKFFEFNGAAKDEAVPGKKAEDPTVKDLLKIIQQQNEQLLILQKQVARLIENQETPRQIEAQYSKKQIEAPSTHTYPHSAGNIFGENLVASTEHEVHGAQDLRNGPLPKFAIDVMTSFEVSIRRQQNFSQRNKYHKEYLNSEPKIQEITESENNSLSNDGNAQRSCDKYIFDDLKSKCADSDSMKAGECETLVLDEQLPVREDCPSPVNSIHVDMQDYSSDSDSDTDCSSRDAGWTFYNNVMEQVNNILEKNNVENHDSIPHKHTMNKVKEATLRHLQSVGVSIPLENETENSVGSVNGSDKYSPAEISFAVQQLLMKYLPDDQLVKLARQPKDVRNNGEANNLIKKRPEFSFATLQYMKKYDLITSGSNERADPFFQKEPAKQKLGKPAQASQNTAKILDITTLKQQPKLL